VDKVDVILNGGTVVTMDADFRIFFDGAVAIRGRQIVAVGSSDEINAAYTADEVVDCTGHYVMPGLINAHTHVPMTLLRGLADDLRLDVWLMGYVMPTEREFVDPGFCRLGTSLACAELIRGGVTSFADMYFFEGDIAQATADAGLRALVGQTILKFPAPDAASFEDSINYARGFIDEWRDHPLVTPALAPHAPYSSTDEMLRRVTEIALETNTPVIIHVAETRQEVDDHVEQYDMTVVPWLESIGLLQAKVLTAHCVHINTTEMHILQRHGATVSHNPTANLKLASGIAPVAEMLEQGLTVGIGTDGPGSNNDLDMFEEMRLAAILAKAASNDPTALPARQALLMATRHGAEAMFMADRTGSLEAGKLADVIVVNGRTVHNYPHFKRDPESVYSQIVYAGKSSDVRHVICDGRWLMRDRNLLTLDEIQLKAQADEYAVKVDEFLAAREGDILSKLLAIGGLERAESFEVQTKAVLRTEGAIDRLLQHPDVQVLRHIHYRQYDTYFLFDDPTKGWVRYREDDGIDAQGNMTSVRSRLTFTLPNKESEFFSTVFLSYSRFIADADRPLRFYREYFQPTHERELHKDRYRWHIHYQGVLFYVNVDRVLVPNLSDTFIELKSRTWSARDAQNKAERIQEMLNILGIAADDVVLAEYLEMAEETGT
jgi:5-methylthioadenosine/S-adenosylhomocysteine deaminase